MWHAQNEYFGTFPTPEAAGKIKKAVAMAYAWKPREITRGVGKKALVQTPQFDTNYFRLCDNEDPGMRYGIWEDDQSMLLNVLRPAMNNQRTTELQFIDFRETIRTQVRVNSDWCTVPVSFPAPAKLGKCVLRYVHNFNKHYVTNQGILTPNDIAEQCYRQVIYDRDGNQLTKEEDYQRYMVLERMKWNMLHGLIHADPAADATQYISKGIRAWFRDFAADHTELGAGCEWIAPSIVADAVDAGNVANVVERRIKAINDRRRQMAVQSTGMTGDNRIPMDSFYLFMNDRDAECVIKAHVCQDVCGGSPGIVFNTRDQLRDWKRLYPEYLTGGRFGQGFITTPNGMEISILRNTEIPSGEFYLLHQGSPSDPEGGLRLSMANYAPYLNYVRERGFTLLDDSPTLFGGSVVVLQSTDLCGDKMYRWNWELMSREPWTLTQYTNLEIGTCDEPMLVTLPDLPTATGLSNPY